MDDERRAASRRTQRLRFAVLALLVTLIMWGFSAGYRAMLDGASGIVQRAAADRTTAETDE